MRVKERLWALSEKEKQTLRLIVRGHDAKSTARRLGLSVHTINERLRDARRKLAVSSSREAARLLLEAEGNAAGPPTPDFFGDAEIGEDAIDYSEDQEAAPIGGARRLDRRPWIIIGVVLMTFTLGLLAMLALPDGASTSPQIAASSPAASSEAADLAQQWLTLVDQERWDESYRETGASFRKLNTVQIWAETSKKVRAPLGAVITRTLVSQETVPAPPSGYELVKFRTRFANKAEIIETVTLDREDGRWRVAGVMIGE